MKKLILILLLLASNAIGQTYYYATQSAYPTNLNTRAIQFFNRVSQSGYTLSPQQKRWYNDSLFQPLLDSGLIGNTRSTDSLVALWVLVKFPNNDSNIIKLNILDTSYTLSGYGGIGYTDTGVVGGINKYFNTNYKWWTAKADSINISLGVYHFGTVTNGLSQVFIGSSNFPSFIGWVNAGSTYAGTLAGVGASEYSPLTTGNPYVKGMAIISTRGNRNAIFYSNGTNQGFKLQSQSFTNFDVYILSTNSGTGVSTESISVYLKFAFIGKGLHSEGARKLSNILNNSLKGRNQNQY